MGSNHCHFYLVYFFKIPLLIHWDVEPHFKEEIPVTYRDGAEDFVKIIILIMPRECGKGRTMCK